MACSRCRLLQYLYELRKEKKGDKKKKKKKKRGLGEKKHRYLRLEC